MLNQQSPENNNFIRILVFILITAGVFAGAYFVSAKYFFHTWPFQEREIIEPSKNTIPTVSKEVQNRPSPSSSIADLQSSAKLQGRIIDIYPNKQVLTVQTVDGQEEVVTGSKPLPESLERGMDINISGSFDRGIFLLSSLSILSQGSLKFKDSFSEIENRQKSAQSIDASGLNLHFGENQGLPKPAYLIFISPKGEILSPFFTSMPVAEYSVDGQLDTVEHALKASSYITIPIMSRGLWAVKFVTLPGADLSTIFGFEPGLPAKKLSERNGKLWYFNNVKLEIIGKIQASLSKCDDECKKNSGNKQTEYLFFGALGDPAIQKTLFGRSGDPYKLEEYRLGDKETYFGGITCFHIIQTNDRGDSISTSKMSLYGWEIGALVNAGGVCDGRVIDNEGYRMSIYHIVQ